jgi:hypothetical protein
MKIKILLLALLPACQVMAQDIADDEHRHAQVKDAFMEDIKLLEQQGITSAVSKAEVPKLSATREMPEGVKEGFDYFKPELYVNNSIRNMPAASPHTFSIRRSSNVSVVLDDVLYSGLECTLIEDKYSMHYEGYPDDYQFENTIFQYRNAEGKEVATVTYVQRMVSGLMMRYKLISKGAAAITSDRLTIVPNPAGSTFSIDYDIAQKGTYAIRITDLSGRTLYTIQDRHTVEPGRYKRSVSPGLQAGAYLVALQSGAHTLTQKLIIK